jgi:UDP-N-acetylmuramyl pentapeptide synthase
MGSALETLALIAGSEPALALLGDMKELGDYSERLHQELGALAARLNPARIVFVGEFGRSFAKGYRSIKAASGALSLCQDKQEAWDAVKDEITNYRTILVKGSRSMAMEELADRILEIA